MTALNTIWLSDSSAYVLMDELNGSGSKNAANDYAINYMAETWFNNILDKLKVPS
ncbi:hypothetical protein MARBORIA2_18760 [Methanobrevibacter arboriphilus]|jgi:hypothetical protein|uniref:Uncharacterized protein n=1 Tax=Methanobrevibacter arboriphilus TaxID=39441 RepID=A0ACA8R316_METAZ|nr:hypothetical protein [Methanobrevibacter arboriphilus]BBL61773.1 hypothetical protein MarbSA_08130 [Methanobrevibacter arboriphilus]GLI12786.1 hypothetical protein MARBORIA2_18760 [Methanobrevibacter arboriphilus]